MKYINTLKFDELSLYGICYCTLLGIIFSFTRFIEILIPDRHSKDVPGNALFILFIISLIMLVIYHAFSNRRKYLFEKELMLLVVLFNLIFSVISSIAIFHYKNTWLCLFPLLNIIHGSILVLLIRFQIINAKNIADANADRRLVIESTIIITVTFLVSRFYFKQHFLLTYPVCLTINYFIISFINPLFLGVYLRIKK